MHDAERTARWTPSLLHECAEACRQIRVAQFHLKAVYEHIHTTIGEARRLTNAPPAVRGSVARHPAASIPIMLGRRQVPGVRGRRSAPERSFTRTAAL